MADIYSKEEMERRKRRGALLPLPEAEDESEVTLPPTLPTKLGTQTPAEKAAAGDEKTQVEQKIAGQFGLSKLVVPEIAPATTAKAPTVSWDKFKKVGEDINKQFEQDRKLAPEVEQAFATRQDALQTALSDAKSVYEQATAKARSEADRREAITRWGSIAESLSQALVKYFAARQGAKTGMLLGSKLAFEKYDWQKDLDRSLERLKTDTNEAKTRLGISQEEVEAGMKGVEAERKAAVGEREAVARQRAGLSEDLLKEQARAEVRSVEDYIASKNRAAQEAQKETAQQAKEQNKELLARQKIIEDTRGIIAKTEAQDPKSAALASSRGQLTENYVKLFSPQQQLEIEQEVADKLGKEQSWIRNTLRSIGVLPEKLTPTEQSIMTKALAESIKTRLPTLSAVPGTPAAPAAPAQTGGQNIVIMVNPRTEEKIQVPQNQLEEARRGGALTPEEFEAQRRK
jgi:hypothetical protein